MLDNRALVSIPNFVMTDDILRASILSYLAYLDTDLFYLKWDAYKNTLKDYTDSPARFYSSREKQSNTLFYNITKMPIFYDGSINLQNTRDAQAYLVEKDNIQYVVFRGTSNIFDFLSDFDFIQVPLEGYSSDIKVHRGFYMQFLSIKDEIFKDIDPSKKVVFCGHSLAAALATIASIIYQDLYKETDISLITFGSPMVGNSEFVSLFNKTIKFGKHMRFVTKNDIVPIMSAIFDYKHVSEAYSLSEGHIYKESGDVHWLLKTFYSILNVAKPISMHNYNTYIRLILSLNLIGNTCNMSVPLVTP